MKKYLIFAAAAALTLASCAKVETFTKTEMDEDIPIGFSNYTPRALTKAGDSYTETTALPNASTIGVYGYSPAAVTTGDAHFLGTETPAFITNGEVAFAAASSVPKGTTVTRYWPKDLKNLLSFYAYYPYQSAVSTTAGITKMPVSTTAGLGAADFEFTQTGDVTTMIDFMLSKVQNDMYFWDGTNKSSNKFGRKSTSSGTTHGIVPLTLTHMMSNVNFYFKTNISTDGVSIKVKEASIAGVLSKGQFGLTYAVPAAGTTAGEGNEGGTTFNATSVAASAYGNAVTIPIGSTNTTEDFTYIILPKPSAPGVTPAVTPAPVINYVDKAGTKTKNNFLFIPQTLSDDVKVTIKYDLTQGTATTENTVEVKIKGAANTDNTITAWAYNTKYNYIFTIGLNEILFTGAAVTWDFNETNNTGNITVL
jgi:hypothetical protein